MILSKLFAVDKQGLVIRGTQNRMRVECFANDRTGNFLIVTNRGALNVCTMHKLMQLILNKGGER
jgi:hypothetical protein